MMWYADASFIVSAFGEDANSHEAVAWLRTCDSFPILVSRLTLLEVDTAFRAAVKSDRLTEAKWKEAQRRIQQGLREGLLLRREVAVHQWFPQAHRITQHASTLSTSRALDVLHVAAAIVLKTKGFLSFDKHQGELAQAEGFDVVP